MDVFHGTVSSFTERIEAINHVNEQRPKTVGGGLLPIIMTPFSSSFSSIHQIKKEQWPTPLIKPPGNQNQQMFGGLWTGT